MSKRNNLKDYLTDLYQGISSKKPGASRNPQDFRAEIESIKDGGDPLEEFDGICFTTGTPTEEDHAETLYEYDGKCRVSGEPAEELPIPDGYIKPSGSVTITENKTVDVTEKAEVVVNVPIPEIPEVTSEEKTVTPMSTEQTVLPTNADYLSKVTVKPIPDYYRIPDGTKSITQNGTHDVTEYASVDVNVPVPDGYIQPSGDLEITENGTFDVTDKASVTVEVEGSAEANLIEKTITANGTYSASANGADGFSKVVVNVPNSGSSECSGNHIIEVDELPTENIDETALYEMDGVYYRYSAGGFTDVILFLFSAQSLLSQTPNAELYWVKTKPTENIVISDLNIGSAALYYVEDDNDIFIYADISESGTPDWVSLSVLYEGTPYNITFKGVISEMSEATEIGYYACIRSSSWKTYVRMNGTISKGQIITMNLDGQNRLYRILKANGTIAECLALFTTMNATMFNEDGTNIYEGSTLDTFLNTTWYGTLSDTAKAAIVPKTFTQDSWYDDNSGNPIYSGYYGETNAGTTPYTISRGDTAYGSSITRNVYALSVQDVLDYVLDTTVGDGLLQNYNIWKMFWNVEEPPTIGISPYLRSANATHPSYVCSIYNETCQISVTQITQNSRAVYPAFTIDLSKIEWEI